MKIASSHFIFCSNFGLNFENLLF